LTRALSSSGKPRCFHEQRGGCQATGGLVNLFARHS